MRMSQKNTPETGQKHAPKKPKKGQKQKTQNKIGPTAVFAPLTSRMESYMEKKVKELRGIKNPSSSKARLQSILDDVLLSCTEFAEEGRLLAEQNEIRTPKSFQRLFHIVNFAILGPLRELLNVPHKTFVNYIPRNRAAQV